MKKAAAFITAVLAIALFALVGCAQERKVYEGKDAYGRTLGEKYAVDSEETGVYEVPYEIGDTSVMGKAMISKYCADYTVVERSESGYTLTYLCKKDALRDVVIVRGDERIKAESGERDGYAAFAFDVSYEELGEKITLECVVALMNRTVSYSVSLSLQDAVLAG